MRALVTGIGGQDGSYLAEQLLAEGTEVHALAYAGDGPPPHCPPAVVLHSGDVTEVAATGALVRDVAPDEIYHLAALSSVARSWREPELTARVNGLAAVGLLDSARRWQEESGRRVAFVQASSAEIFGSPATAPQDEDTPVRPTNPYGAAKAYAHLAVGMERSRGLHACSAILYNHESPRRPRGFVTSSIVDTVVAISRGEANELVLGNLEARRDWGWAPEYVDAMVRMARAPEPDDFVVATGRSHSVRDFAAAAFAAAGVEDWEPLLRVDPALVRPTDAADLRGDPSRAARVLGWRPEVSFADVVGRMVGAAQASRP